MSYLFSKGESLSPSSGSVCFDSAKLFLLAEQLQDVAHTLFAACESGLCCDEEEHEAMLLCGNEKHQDKEKVLKNGEYQNAASAPKPRKTPDELRTYRVPGFIINEERRLLKEHNAEDWQDLLYTSWDKLDILRTLMLHFDDSKELDGFFLNRIAEDLLAPPLDVLNHLCSLVADFNLCEQEDAVTEAITDEGEEDD